MELDSIPVFVKVAQLGSFTQASKALNMPNTTVSAKVASLERHLGVTLIQRTTRKLALTEAGRAYLERCVRALDELQTAESELHSSSNEISGLLRITASVDIGQSLLAIMVQRYLQLHPRMQVDLIVTNRVVDLISEGVDLAIRGGQLKDSSLMGKKFVNAKFGLWASKAYLKKEGAPRDLRDLKNFKFISFKAFGGDTIEFSNGRQSVKAEVSRANVQADDFGAVRALAELGMGIAILPNFMCENDSSGNKLENILPEWLAREGNLTLVYPRQQFVSPKVRAFIEVADDFFKQC